ncbi:LuxR family transcriptional regulator [Actinoplanes lobatus]|uniref:LuxR family maltose regulon positive regulatory protein n=1 Tax=Actinoplanes lobatus TaxID=113568 RepID=A0A7W7HNE6_9ACTN|nr:LuxR C-terminal-related transcriptional regulator [Actinoplanes lobatus]MBB4753756.1 LuxR family maltose regulon positive regulatory protein [Actinoplanes lobatus]GGN72678.1 LuxR family transcriptional regulator [Actinoplanes lobatus]GIE42091.1 LuxR family transcriptional regulator [Actinoplanes lobatus]
MDSSRIGAPLLPLIPVKTAQPRVARAGVDRQRLFDLLDAAMDTPVTLVSAGAGWGKTTLVSAWARAGGKPVAWLNLDRHDNDPQTFWAYVVAALRTAGLLTDGNPLAALTSVPADQRERIRVIADGLSHLPDRAVLIIDDFHEIDDTRVLAEMSDLLRYPPEPVRLLLISRARPVINLHRLRAAGLITEIRASHLAFTEPEAADLVTGHGITLTAPDLATLLNRTEGWAIGLHLGAGFLAVHHSRSVAEFAGDGRGIDEYLTEEVLANRTGRQRRFLLQTSICERICAGLANAITTGRDGQRMLEEFEHENDFVVRLGDRPLWFRYHHLLRDALGHRLQVESPAMVAELHRRAARWHAANDSVMEALTHAVSAGDWTYIGRLVTGQAAPLVLSAHRSALVRLLRQVPADRLDSTAELMICAAVLLFHDGDYEAIPARLDHARRLLRRRPGDEHRPVELMRLTLQLAVDRAVGDLPAVRAGCDELLALLATDVAAGGAAVTQQRAIALNNRGLANLWSGDLDAAVRDLWASAGASRAAGLELAEINADGHLGLLEVMCGSVAAARQIAGDARELATKRGWQHTVQAVAAHLAMVLVHLERGEFADAEQALQDGMRAHHSEPEAAQRVVMLGAQARLAATRGEPAKARVFLEAARADRSPRTRIPWLDRWLAMIEIEADLAAGDIGAPPAGITMAGGDLAHQVAHARLALAHKDFRRAGHLLDPRPAVLPYTAATVEAGLIIALIADARGQAGQAVELLSDTLHLAEREEIRRPFLVHADGRLDDLLQRLQLLHPGDGHATFLEELRSALRATRKTAATEVLSGREAEVLLFLPTMLGSAEIARELGISVNTVKAHIRAIYRKLGVAKRSEAVARARDLGLL